MTRMRTARQQEARSIRAEGAKRAQIIRAEADAEAAQTYAASFGKDAEFYDFYRAMQSYETTFIGDGGEQVVADDDHPVAAERISEGIHWTLGVRRCSIRVHALDLASRRHASQAKGKE